jgi:hypothetical protein
MEKIIYGIRIIGAGTSAAFESRTVEGAEKQASAWRNSKLLTEKTVEIKYTANKFRNSKSREVKYESERVENLVKKLSDIYVAYGWSSDEATKARRILVEKYSNGEEV